jgi:hypothetical protein
VRDMVTTAFLLIIDCKEGPSLGSWHLAIDVVDDDDGFRSGLSASDGGAVVVVPHQGSLFKQRLHSRQHW